MVKLKNSRERTARSGRFGRMRSVAAVLATALVAPVAFGGVASTVGTTLTAAPAAALPVKTFVVSGDAASRTGLGSGAWGFHGSDYDQLRSIITSSANFGPNGTVKTASFTIGNPITTITDEALAGVDVFFSGAIQTATFGYTTDEEAALERFVARGGMLILNVNSASWNTADFLGADVKDPIGLFEEGTTHEGASINGSGRYAAGDPDTNTPAPSVASGSHPIVVGPFGTVTTFQNWHTVVGFTTLPGSAQVLARLNYDCSPQNSAKCQTTAGPTTTTSATTTTGGPTTTAPPQELDYNQDFNNLPTLAVIPPIYVNSVRRGAIILTSDVDTYSDHSEGGEVYAQPMLAGNEMLAKNTFAYIANELTDGYVSLAAPTRVLDTRLGTGVVAGKVTAGGTRTLQVTGANGIPANATAVALNVTATNPSGASFISVYPTGSVATGTTPSTSNLNFNANQTIPNMVIVALPTSGQLTFFNESGSVDILADAVGYYIQGSGDRFNAVTPDRILDTRTSNTPVLANTPRSVQVSGAGAGRVPAGATAVALNVTSVNNTAGGYLTVYPGDVTTPPNASNLNFVPGLVIPNLVIAKLSPSGTINIFNAAGSTDVVVDVLGYYVSTSAGGSFGPRTPTRVLDTRSGLGGTTGPVGPDGTVTLTVLGVGGVPSTGVRTVLLNVTAAGPTSDSFITVWPDGTRPNASNLNTATGVNVPNLVLVGVGSDGKVRLFNKNGNVHLIADVMGYYS